MKKMKDFDFERYAQYFRESDFWNKLGNVARKAGIKIVYSALLLYYVMMDEAVPKTSKWLVAGALGYFILPFDFIPDFIPVLGFVDDLSILLLALGEVAHYIDEEIQEKAKNKLTEWFNTFDEGDVKDIDSKIA